MILIDADTIEVEENSTAFLLSDKVQFRCHWDAIFTGMCYIIGDAHAVDESYSCFNKRRCDNTNALVSIVTRLNQNTTWILPFINEVKHHRGFYRICSQDGVVTTQVCWVNDNTKAWVIDHEIVMSSNEHSKEHLAIQRLKQKGLPIFLPRTVTPFLEKDPEAYTFKDTLEETE